MSAYLDEGKLLKIGFSLDQVQVIRQAFEGKFALQPAIEIQRYADLAAINAEIKTPNSNMMVIVTGQGAAVYDGSAWVLASNDTTAVT